MSAEVLHCLRSLGKAGCQQQRELVPRLQHPLVHQQLPGAPKAAFTRAAAQSCSTNSPFLLAASLKTFAASAIHKGKVEMEDRKTDLGKNSIDPT